MKRFPRLSNRILLCMIIVGLLPTVLMSVENYFFNKKTVEDSEQGHLGYALKSRLTFLEAWLHHTKKEFHYTSKSSCTLQNCSGHKENAQQLNPTCKALQAVMRGHATYQSLAVYDDEWTVLVTTEETKNVVIPDPSDSLKSLFERATHFTTGPVTFAGGRPILPLCQPALDTDGQLLTLTVGFLDINASLTRILGKSSDIGETGKFFLLDSDGTYLWAPADLQHLVGTKTTIPESLYRGPYKEVTHYRDGKGVKVLGITTPVGQSVPWLLLAQIDEQEAYRILKERMLVSILTGIATLFLIGFVCFRLSRHLSNPLNALARVAHNIASGNMHDRVPEFSEQETREVGVAFNTMLDRLAASQRALARSETLAAVGELSSSIVHEMRSPLSSMKINLRSLGDKLHDDPVYSEIAHLSIEQAQRLEIMLSDLMKYGTPLDLQIEPTTFNHLVGSVLRVLSEEAKSKSITIDVNDNLNNLPIQIDRELMTRALTNLVDNAIKWTPQDGMVEITGDMAPEENDWILIQVRDNGPGIKSEQRKKLFKLFYSTRDTGHGIGLANVKKIIEYHDGFVAGDNAEKGGAVFSILLPVGGPEN